MNADEIDAQIRMLAAERRLPPSHLARWLAMDPASRAAMLDIARVIRLRTGQLMTALETLEEIGLRGRDTFLGSGGTSFALIPCLNEHPLWLEALEKMVRRFAVPGPKAERAGYAET